MKHDKAPGVGHRVALFAPNGVLQAVMTVKERFEHDKKLEIPSVFRTEDPAHPGVKAVMEEGDVSLAGPVEALAVCVDPQGPEAFLDYRRTPKQTREEFTHMLVHDLRSPLGAVIGGLSLADELTEVPEAVDVEMVRETVHIALDGSKHLLDLINSILDINKLESGRMTLEVKPAALFAVAGDAVEGLRGLTAEFHVGRMSDHEQPRVAPECRTKRCGKRSRSQNSKG